MLPATVSSTADTSPTHRIVRQGHHGRARRVLSVVLAATAVAGAAGWAWLSLPELEHGSSWGVFSNDHDILEIRSLTGPDTTVLSANDDGTSTVMLTLRNDGPVPVTLLDVWPEHAEQLCGWGPTERRVRTDPRRMYADEGATAPLPGASIMPGTEVAVYIEGAMNDPAGCQNVALSSVAMIPVDVRILGRTSTVEIELQHRLGWTDDLDSLADQEVTVWRSPAG